MSIIEIITEFYTVGIKMLIDSCHDIEYNQHYEILQNNLDEWTANKVAPICNGMFLGATTFIKRACASQRWG